MDIDTFVNVTSRAWALPILSSLHTGVPGRQATLLKATGASRTAFSQSIAHLIETGLLERNPGHGHPLRPEFRLTLLGKSMAKIAYDIQSATHSDDHALLRRAWTVPVLTSLRQPRHFNEIGRTLGAVTDRALSLSLKTLEDKDWVRRKINYASRPPRAVYSSVNTGQVISRLTAQEITLLG